MSSTEKCVEMLSNVMDGGLSPSFDKLIMGDRTNWKRFSKFHYREGVRRYFYLVESCLIATVDERDATAEEMKERSDRIKALNLDEERISPEEAKKMTESEMVKIMVRPPMLWEQFMLRDARPNDNWVKEELGDIWEEYDEFCYVEAGKGSEPQQYTFEIGPHEGGWIFFSPIKCDHFDQHLTGDLDPIIPAWLLKSGEIMECTYAIDEHPLWTMNCGGDLLEAIKKELTELGFVPCKEPNYAKCV